MRTAIFPGSFDPITNGHVDVVVRALSMFDSVIVAVLNNPEKKSMFTLSERVALIQDVFAAEGQRVLAKSFSGLLVDFARSQNASIILRGLRAISDFDYEAQMALMNRSLDPNIETVFLMASEANSYVSSSIVRQVARFGGDVRRLVPARIVEELAKKFPAKK
ncbi:MAG: pantetheine-phosphate adenylyltransferase [Bdellovibrionota bacterium]|nr:MAG: pantetheine-phosphate adenylyltransferase [Bdellovibrionota bacterium]